VARALAIACVFYGALFVTYRLQRRPMFQQVPRDVAVAPTETPKAPQTAVEAAVAQTHQWDPDWRPPTLPKADARPWRTGEYRILPSERGIVRVQKEEKLLFASIGAVRFVPCGGSKVIRCMTFPNGQDVELSGELEATLPSGLVDRYRYFSEGSRWRPRP
jgi:hypothetical protein